MRWDRKALPLPKEGDVRIMIRFAWIPKEVEDKVVWLESYYSHQVYQYTDNIDFTNKVYRWVETDRTLVSLYEDVL